MTVDKAIEQKIKTVLCDENYCNKEMSRAIAKEVLTEVKEQFDSDISKLEASIDKLLKMNDRLWDSIHKMTEPRCPRLSYFFHFRWMKFWRNWNLKFWK